MVRDILLFKLDSGTHLEFSFEELSVAQTPPHRRINILLKRPSSGELLNEVSCWKLFGFNPVAASTWSCRLMSTLQKLSTTKMAHSAHSLDITFRSLLSAGTPQRDPFCSSQGDYTKHLGIGPSPVCEVIHISTVMHYELWESELVSICVLLLGSLTQATPVNGLDCSFSSFRHVWDSLPTLHNPQGVFITSDNLAALSRSWSFHATCYFLLLFLSVFACSSSWTLTP